ncbi:hypothetical protein GJAV_G00097610 [Gymnothorax javanicus]|nr:hypothetical protein GJAV_G00097610 [Gymnothorax javanicus]
MFLLKRKNSLILSNVHCDVAEDNKRDREHYESEWHQMRPRGKITLSEHDAVRKESYEQEVMTDFLKKKSLEHGMGVGRQGERLRQNRSPLKNVLPMPLFLPRKVVPFKDSEHPLAPAEYKPVVEFGKGPSWGLRTNKQAVSQITKGLPKIKHVTAPGGHH